MLCIQDSLSYELGIIEILYLFSCRLPLWCCNVFVNLHEDKKWCHGQNYFIHYNNVFIIFIDTYLYQPFFKSSTIKQHPQQMLGCGALVRIIALPHVRCACRSACGKGFELCVRKCVRMGILWVAICDCTFYPFLSPFMGSFSPFLRNQKIYL